VNSKLSGTLTITFPCTVTLQLIAGSLHDKISSLGQAEENTCPNRGKALEQVVCIVLANNVESDDGDVVADADSDGCSLKTDNGGVVAKLDRDERQKSVDLPTSRLFVRAEERKSKKSAESGGEVSEDDGGAGPLGFDDRVVVARGVENNRTITSIYHVKFQKSFRIRASNQQQG